MKKMQKMKPERKAAGIKTYETNCICPKCGGYLQTSDLLGYPFVCRECDENFYSVEVMDYEDEYAEISVPCTQETFEKFRDDLLKSADASEADFVGYDTEVQRTDIGWGYVPCEEQLLRILGLFDKMTGENMLMRYRIMTDCQIADSEPEIVLAEQDQKKALFGLRDDQTYICHFFDSKFMNEKTEKLTLDDALQYLAIKDGADLVMYASGNYGYIAYYNGIPNGFEIIR